jgi:hypothetical protein
MVSPMGGPPPTAVTLTGAVGRASLTLGAFLVALFAAWGFPRLDHALNPGADQPGVISYLGVGLVVLVVTALLLFAGVRSILPKTAVFLAAALGYNALLIAVKFSLSPAALYASQPFSTQGYLNVSSPLTYPGLAAVTAVLYGGAFFVLYGIFRSGLQRRLGVTVATERRLVELFVVMFVLAVVGGMTMVGLLGFLEYSIYVFFTTVLSVLIAIALLAAILLCSVAFKEATDQAVILRDVSMLSTFAWVGLAFIAAYHILWLVFLLTLISLWPLRTFTPTPTK